jgi:hypothetical protein
MLMPPTQTTNTASDNPYDFIVNSESKPKKQSLLNSQTPFRQRLLVILGGAVILIILIVVISSIFSSKPNTAGVISIAEQQGTLISMAAVAGLNANQQVTKNLAANITLTMTSGQLSVINYIESTGKKITSTSLLTSHTTQLSSQLSSTPSNNFDSVYIQLTQTELASYETMLKSAYSSSDPASQKQLLSNLYDSLTLLIKEASSAANDL